MDHLRIVDLEIMAHHGVFPEEKKLGQKFLVSVDCAYNMKNATKEEDLTQSVHYGLLCNDITRLLTENTYDLLETCAYRIVQHIFPFFPLSVKRPYLLKSLSHPSGFPLPIRKFPSHENGVRIGLRLARTWGIGRRI